MVWPFESGLRIPQTPVALVEIYPSIIDRDVKDGRGEGEIIDRAQVRLLADHFARLDRSGELARLFEGPLDLTEEHRDMITREEGWILGVPL